MEPGTLIREYLLLGLRFDRIEEGYVDSFTGDPHLSTPSPRAAPDPADLARQAQRLLSPSCPARAATTPRAAYVGAHLRALACAGRKFAGEEVGFVDEVRDYFDVRITKGDQDRYREAHANSTRCSAAAGRWPTGCRPIARAEEIPPERLERVHPRVLQRAARPRARHVPAARDGKHHLRGRHRQAVVGFNYYHGDYRSTVAVNADLKQQMSNLPRLVAHESYPGHHTEHCRKEAGLVEGRAGRADDLPGQHPAVPDGRGPGRPRALRRDRAGLGESGRRRSTPTSGCGSTVSGPRRSSEATAALADVRQDAALMLHDEHRDVDDVVGFLKRWLLVDDERARQMLRFLSSPLWRAYTSTYVEGYRLLRGWLDDAPDGVGLTSGSARCSTSR